MSPYVLEHCLSCYKLLCKWSSLHPSLTLAFFLFLPRTPWSNAAFAPSPSWSGFSELRGRPIILTALPVWCATAAWMGSHSPWMLVASSTALRTSTSRRSTLPSAAWWSSWGLVLLPGIWAALLSPSYRISGFGATLERSYLFPPPVQGGISSNPCGPPVWPLLQSFPWAYPSRLCHLNCEKVESATEHITGKRQYHRVVLLGLNVNKLWASGQIAQFSLSSLVCSLDQTHPGVLSRAMSFPLCT